MSAFDLFIPSRMRDGKWMMRILIPLFLSLFLGLAVSSVWEDSATDDEPSHIAAGYIKLKYGYFDFYNEQPPLIDSLIAFPLLLSKVALFPIRERVSTHWGVGEWIVYRSGNDADRIVLLARLPIIFLFLILCLLVFQWIFEATRNRGSAFAGFLLTGFCPNLLAHGRLATVDLGVTLFIFASTLFFLRFLYAPAPWNILLTGLLMGGAFLSKLSGLILLPYFALLFSAFVLLEGKRRWSLLAPYLWRGALIILVSLTFMECVYLQEMNRSYLEQAYPNLAGHVWGRLTIPYHEYLKHLKAVYEWVGHPYDQPQFLFGRFSSTGWWYYYPAAFALKTPIGTMLLLLFACLTLFLAFRRCKHSKEQREPALFHLFSVLLFILVFFGISAGSKIDLGIRYILPVYPFIYVAISLALYHHFSRSDGMKRCNGIVIGALIAWNITSSLLSYPAYIGYFNELIGDSRNADRYLIDSNLDWGQDLKRLAKWVEENKIYRIHIHYFGGGSPDYYLGSAAIPWQPSFPREKGYYAVSRHYYRASSYYKDKGMDYERYFKDAKFVTMIGKSIYIYRVD